MGKPIHTRETLLALVDRRGEDDCWPWKGWIGAGGYGRVQILGKSYYAHRVIYRAFNPDFPLAQPKDRRDTGFLLHSCDNPICCNPRHLRIGTQLENAADCRARSRQNKGSGEKSTRAKLTQAQAREIRRLRSAGIPARILAEQFTISLPSVKTLLRGNSYREVA